MATSDKNNVTKRSDVNRPLTYDEGDNNFTELENVIDDTHSNKNRLDNLGEENVTTSTGTQTLVEAIDQRWIHFETVSDMESAENLSVGDRVRTSGYNESGDGGGNDYEIVAAGTGTDDGGAFIDLSGSGYQAKGLFPDGRMRPEQYGAKTDGTDATSHINALFDAVRASFSSNYVHKAIEFSPAETYTCEGSINATGIRAFNFSIFGNGAVIYSKASGKVAFDMAYSRFSYVEALTVYGDETSKPLVGFQVGRVNSQVASCHQFNNLTTDGYFTRTGFYNYAAEICQYNHCRFWNRDSSPSSYCSIMDGDNTWGITSDFQTIEVSEGTPSSFNEQVFINLDARKENGGPTLWMKRTNRHHYYNSYAVSSDDTTIDLVFDAQGHKGLHLDVHCETSSGDDGLLSCVRFSGRDVCTLEDFTFIDHSPHCKRAVFDSSEDATVTQVIMVCPDIRIPNFNQNPTNGLFNPKGNFYTYGGKIYCGEGGEFTNHARNTSDILTDDLELSTFGVGSYRIQDEVDRGEVVHKGRYAFYGAEFHNKTGVDLLQERKAWIDNGQVGAYRVFYIGEGSDNVNPVTLSGYAAIFTDSSTGELQVKFSDGTVKTLATPT